MALYSGALDVTAEPEPRLERGLDVVVFDFAGVCTPSPEEFTSGRSTLGPLRSGVAEIVAAVRRHGPQVVLLSNEFDRGWVEEIPGFPQFDHIAVGSDNSIYKPDRRAFQRVLHVVGSRPERCLVIDDDPTNCRVARSIGCRAIEFDTTDVTASWAAVAASVGLGDPIAKTKNGDDP